MLDLSLNPLLQISTSALQITLARMVLRVSTQLAGFSVPVQVDSMGNIVNKVTAFISSFCSLNIKYNHPPRLKPSVIDVGLFNLCSLLLKHAVYKKFASGVAFSVAPVYSFWQTSIVDILLGDIMHDTTGFNFSALVK